MSLVSLKQGNVKKSEKLMKIDENRAQRKIRENLHTSERLEEFQ